MLQQMINSKLNDYGPANTETISSNGDKQQPQKKIALRDLQNDKKVTVPISSGSPFLKDRGPHTEISKFSGIKRPTPEHPQSPPQHHCQGGSTANGHLVYARRKFEQEAVKRNYSGKEKITECLQKEQSSQKEQELPRQKTQNEGPKASPFSALQSSQKEQEPPKQRTLNEGPKASPFSALQSSQKEQEPPRQRMQNEGPKASPFSALQSSQKEQEPPRQRTPNEGPKASPFSAFSPVPRTSSITTSSGGPSVPFVMKPPNDVPPTEQNYCSSTPGAAHPDNSQRTDIQYWKERYYRLQSQLRNIDHSSQEEYIQMLRTLSPAGRSKHAVELEKQAIQLMLEEGHEIQRMKVLNVLGKCVPNESSSAQKVQL